MQGESILRNSHDVVAIKNKMDHLRDLGIDERT